MKSTFFRPNKENFKGTSKYMYKEYSKALEWYIGHLENRLEHLETKTNNPPISAQKSLPAQCKRCAERDERILSLKDDLKLIASDANDAVVTLDAMLKK